jgi:hypothetical protein
MSESGDIRWKVYRQIPNFSLLEAAFLWREIELTKEGLESPPHFVEAQRKILNDKIFYLYIRRMDEGLQLHAKPGLSKTEKINEYMRSDEGPYYLCAKMGLVEHHDDPEEEQIGRISYTLVDRYYERLKPKEYEAVSSETLKEIAEILNEKPKFLFPECQGEEKLHHAEKTALLKVIIGLFPESIDPKKSDAVGKLKGAFQLHGIGLDDKTIRKLLKEISPLTEENKPSKKKS